MKQYLTIDPWKIIETDFHPEHNRVTESIFSIGNGRMGQRANFEERYSGDSMQGSYIAGVYYPDKTRVGWWKNGYPEYFAKVLNSTNWIGIDIEIEGEMLDLAKCEILAFNRELNMQEGFLKRTFSARLQSGKEISVESIRFTSIVDDEVGTIRYNVRPLNFDGQIKITPYLDGNVMNEDTNYDIGFWNPISQSVKAFEGYVVNETKKTAFQVATGMKFAIRGVEAKPELTERESYVANTLTITAKANQTIAIEKYAAIVSSLNHDKSNLLTQCSSELEKAFHKGFNQLKKEQAEAWAKKWEMSDIIIEGDHSAQQSIRFNIFQLNQTYTGEDDRLNIGPKGFTGEKYGGSTYWDTEAYCIPFYLATAPEKVAKNLLIYRYKHLPKAIENAQKLGFKAGAALYPMVTINGEECHNEWEITFEEIHRNGAIAFAIYNYIRHTGDKDYLSEYGAEVLIGIARFWAQRVNFSEEKQQYVMLGVTGPNEYENNVNNNWYTNYIARWCLQYTIEVLAHVEAQDSTKFKALLDRTHFDAANEVDQWENIIENLYLPEDKKLGIFLQQDGYLDKEQLFAKDVPTNERPLVQHWSWDRILRSCFIKQADVLQGIYTFEENFDQKTIQQNFDFYEPRTVHESSLSPCVHAILAAKLGYQEKAYEMYLRTARLDLDDYNNDTSDGCHITSMAGTWMAVVHGFAGMRIVDDELKFNPMLPKAWKSFQFTIQFRGKILKVSVDKNGIHIAP